MYLAASFYLLLKSYIFVVSFNQKFLAIELQPLNRFVQILQIFGLFYHGMVFC